MQVDKLDNVWEKKIYLASLIEDFRELQAIELLKDRPSQGPGTWFEALLHYLVAWY